MLGDLAITHRELLKAIELGKPRFMLAHEQVVTARRLLMDLGYKNAAARAALTLRKGAVVVYDLRLIDMYEAATREDGRSPIGPTIGFSPIRRRRRHCSTPKSSSAGTTTMSVSSRNGAPSR